MKLACLDCGAEFISDDEACPVCPECGCEDDITLVPVDSCRLTGGISDDVLDAIAPREHSDEPDADDEPMRF